MEKEKFEKFCSRVKDYQKIPFVLGEYEIATNDIIMIACLKQHEYCESKHDGMNKGVLRLITECKSITSEPIFVETPINIKTEICYQCHGGGRASLCPECEGRGIVCLEYESIYTREILTKEDDCPLCEGTGSISASRAKLINPNSVIGPCDVCDGTGESSDKTKYDIKHRTVDGRWIKKINDNLVDVKFFADYGDRLDPLFFIHSEGIGAVMPLNGKR